MKFTKSLKTNKEFKDVFDNGSSKANKFLVMYVSENNTEENRLGISVSKKVGNSVKRHYIKRCIREIYRLHEDMFNSGLNIVVIARVRAKDLKYHDFEDALLHLMRISKVCI